jgi:hypothetical protein
VAHVVKSLPSKCDALLQKKNAFELGMVARVCNPSPGEAMQEDLEFEASLDYIVSFSPPWTT